MYVKVKSMIGKIYYQLYDIFLYIKHKLRGSTYADYYAERMDIRIKRNTQWGLNQDKSFQLEYLIKQGLRSDSYLLDYGAGALAAGLHFIDHLKSEKYCGVDISESVLKEGKKRISEKNLTDKAPELMHIPSGNLAPLKGKVFDFIWAQSVLTHMPPEAIQYLFGNLRELLKDDGKFFANFKKNDEGMKHANYRDWQYSTQAIVEMAEKNGLQCDIMDDWEHPYDPDKHDTMIRLTIK